MLAVGSGHGESAVISRQFWACWRSLGVFDEETRMASMTRTQRDFGSSTLVPSSSWSVRSRDMAPHVMATYRQSKPAVVSCLGSCPAILALDDRVHPSLLILRWKYVLSAQAKHLPWLRWSGLDRWDEVRRVADHWRKIVGCRTAGIVSRGARAEWR